MSKLSVQTNFWPLYEVENGKWKLNYKPKERKPITEWMKPQGNDNWEKLLVLCGEK